MSRKDIIPKTVAGQTAVKLDIRVINMPLYPTDSVVNVFYGYYKSGDLRIENSIAEGNLQLGDLISSDSKTALLNALIAQVGSVTAATLNFNQLNDSTFNITYTQSGGTKNVNVSGSFFTSDEYISIRNAVFAATSSVNPTPIKRKQITVNSTSAQTNYPVTLTLHNTTGTDTTSDVYLSSNVRSDWGDVRIYSSGLTPLPFAVVSKTATSITVTFSATVINGNTIFYVYYDKPVVAGTITKFGVTTDQHYDSAETYVGRNHALERLDNFVTRMVAYVPDAILEGGDKVGAVTTDAATRIGFMNNVTAKHNGAASTIGCPNYLWGWGNHDFENGVTLANLVSNYSSLPGLVSGTLYGTWEDDNYCYISLDSEYVPGGQTHITSNQGYGYVNTDQLTWLTNTLAAATKPCIVFCHQLLCEADTERIFLTKETYHVQNRTAVRTILENSGKVLFVLQGHTHITSHEVINGIPYLNLVDVNEPPSTTWGWDTPTSNVNGRWGIIEVDRSTMMIKFRQEIQVNTTVQTIYEFFIPYRTIYDSDYGNNPEKVFASSNAALYSKASIVSDATDLYVNDDTFVIAKPASIYDGDPILSDRTIKVYGITNASNYGRLTWYFAPQTGLFKFYFSANLSAQSTKFFKIYNTVSTSPAIYCGFQTNGNFFAYNGATLSTLITGYSLNTWYNVEIQINVTSGTFTILINGVVKATGYSFNTASGSLQNIEIVTEAGNMMLDFMRIENYVTPTPSITTIGSEENI
jgi:hypothetical protein